MTTHVDRFHAALSVLAGDGHIKQRLTEAFEVNLAELHEDELPLTVQRDFAELRQAMYRVTPNNGEGPICASVRKMSCDEAGQHAAAVLNVYRDLVRLSGEKPGLIGEAGNDPMRVPPFLVKSV